MEQNQEKISLNIALNQIHQKKGGGFCSGLTGADKAYFIAQLYRNFKSPLAIIVDTDSQAQTLFDDLSFFIKQIEADIVLFPPYNLSPFNFMAYHNETASRRIYALYQMVVSEKRPIFILPVSTLMQKMLPKHVLCQYAELILEGEELDRELLIKKFQNGGYNRALVVEEQGDYCIRGGIIDVFSPMYSDPVRIEFFGDMVDSIRYFDPSTQRTKTHIKEAVILPAREIVLPQTLEEMISRIRLQAADTGFAVTGVRKLIQKLKDEGVFPGLESLTPLIYEKLDDCFDYLPQNTVYIQIEPELLKQKADRFKEQILKQYESVDQKEKLCLPPDRLYHDFKVIESKLNDINSIIIKSLPINNPGVGDDTGCQTFHFEIQDNQEIRLKLKNPDPNETIVTHLKKWINDQLTSQYDVFLACPKKSQITRLEHFLTQNDFRYDFIESFKRPLSKTSRVFLCNDQISSGFVWPAQKLAILTAAEIFDQKIRKKKSVLKDMEQFLDYGELKAGDLVVHDEHGIGRYGGLTSLDFEGVVNDFLQIIYKDEDRLYLPVDRMNQIHKYMGVEGIEPSLDKMGGKSFEKIKEKVKKNAEKIAGELLALYAQRKVRNGFAFEDVDGSFKSFESGFEFEETFDQQKAIDDVLGDMKNPNSMDRLVCGDVGYGKTEVALRAAFLSISNSKQVAVVVPTTVLAEQHYRTFKQRFSEYPVEIACLNRFRKPKEQREIIARLQKGTVDIVVGTHRLLQKDVVFSDLGLLILDEEQRFGVKHKEKLKKLKSSVDVLTLTATPIPRTLQFSLIGMRDISIISTPPELRKSIVTYISEFDDIVIQEAIRRELDRKGQIYFVHNNIQSIERIATYLKKLVPEVRLDVAHGRLSEDELEKVMLRFVNKDIDMLVCTTIIESGLDIPNANTILINRADRFGLSQIYQLRGRVGRSEDQAYAYLFIPDETILTKDAQKRLKVLMEHSDLGAGFQIAMSDLRIRGGGNLLGANQSGHIAAIGYDMFLKLMEDAISQQKGEPVVEELEPEINLPISALIPETYISEIDQRIVIYRRLAKAKDIKDLSDIKSEFKDRFGKLPIEVESLLLKMMLRLISKKIGLKRLDLINDNLFVYFKEEDRAIHSVTEKLVTADPKRYKRTGSHVLKAQLQKTSLNGLILQAKNILKDISQHVNA